MKNKKTTMIMGIVIIILIGIVSCFLINNSKRINIDFKVSNYYSLARYNYDGDFNKFAKDSYNWYKSIENNEGVYIINTSYNSDELLNLWKKNKVYKTIPTKAFWEFTVSPTYLKEMNISINSQDLEDATKGTRLYLIPNNFTDEDFETMKSYLQETALYELDKSIIKTNFVENKNIKIVRYTPNDSYFTWQNEKGQPITDNAPVIYVCTSENMKYFESESLYATGVDSYIKFSSKEIMEKYTKDDSIKGYNLSFETSSQIYKDASKHKLVDLGIDKAFE